MATRDNSETSNEPNACRLDWMHGNRSDESSAAAQRIEHRAGVRVNLVWQGPRRTGVRETGGSGICPPSLPPTAARQPLNSWERQSQRENRPQAGPQGVGRTGKSGTPKDGSEGEGSKGSPLEVGGGAQEPRPLSSPRPTNVSSKWSTYISSPHDNLPSSLPWGTASVRIHHRIPY